MDGKVEWMDINSYYHLLSMNGMEMGMDGDS